MRNIVFKNLTSAQKKRRILSTCEVVENKGVLTRIRRSFVYIVKSIADSQKEELPIPRVYVLKIKDSRTNHEKFFCRVKGGLYLVNNNKLFFVVFSHSLTINLTPVSATTNHK